MREHVVIREILREFWTDHNKVARRCKLCGEIVPVGAVAYIRQVQKEMGGFGANYAENYNAPRWQIYHEACAGIVGAPMRKL